MLPKSQITLDISIPKPIVACLFSEQIKLLLLFLQTIDDLMIIQSNFDRRPRYDIATALRFKVNGTVRKWWHYAINSVVEMTKKRLDPYYEHKKKKLELRYIANFKQWLIYGLKLANCAWIGVKVANQNHIFMKSVS